MSENWKTLKVGDKIRIVRLPSDANRLGYYFPRDTRRLYLKLIKRGIASRVYQIDRDGLPWIRCRFHSKNGNWEHHFLAINDDSWVRVRRQK